MQVTGLFAGIGGFESGLARAGHATILLCDNDPHATTVLKRRFPDIDHHGNIEDLKSLPSHTDVVTAGFPCQNLSMAGDKAGLDGVKSSVVDHLFRLLRQDPVPWVLIENVYFMLHLAKGAAMERILSPLERLGYRWAYRVVDSRAFGLPQRRRRVFIVATSIGDPRGVLLADNAPTPDRDPPDMTRPIAFYWTEGRSGNGLTADAIPPSRPGPRSAYPPRPPYCCRTVAWSPLRSTSPNVYKASAQGGRPHSAVGQPATVGGWSAMPSPFPWPSGSATGSQTPKITTLPMTPLGVPESPGPRPLGTPEPDGSSRNSPSSPSASAVAACPPSTRTHGPTSLPARCADSWIAHARAISPIRPDSSTHWSMC